MDPTVEVPQIQQEDGLSEASKEPSLPPLLQTNAEAWRKSVQISAIGGYEYNDSLIPAEEDIYTMGQLPYSDSITTSS